MAELSEVKIVSNTADANDEMEEDGRSPASTASQSPMRGPEVERTSHGGKSLYKYGSVGGKRPCVPTYTEMEAANEAEGNEDSASEETGYSGCDSVEEDEVDIQSQMEMGVQSPGASKSRRAAAAVGIGIGGASTQHRKQRIKVSCLPERCTPKGTKVHRMDRTATKEERHLAKRVSQSFADHNKREELDLTKIFPEEELKRRKIFTNHYAVRALRYILTSYKDEAASHMPMLLDGMEVLLQFTRGINTRVSD